MKSPSHDDSAIAPTPADECGEAQVEVLRNALSALPLPLEVPDQWQQIAAQLSPHVESTTDSTLSWRWQHMLAVAASAAALGLSLTFWIGPDESKPAISTAAQVELLTLIAEAHRLEDELAQLHPHRELHLATRGLKRDSIRRDIALIDAQLELASADIAASRTLWRAKVELLENLLWSEKRPQSVWIL